MYYVIYKLSRDLKYGEIKLKMDYKKLFAFSILFLIILSILVSAQELDGEKEIKFLGIEVEEIIVIGSSILAIFLFIFTFMAYRRSGSKRLLSVAIAFFLFVMKGILVSIDVFFPGQGTWTDLVANILDFAILFSFFFGVVKREG